MVFMDCVAVTFEATVVSKPAIALSTRNHDAVRRILKAGSGIYTG